MSDGLISMENWDPEKAYFPKNEIVGKTHKTYINRAYALREDKRILYILESYDNIFGDRKVQLTITQANRIKHLRIPFYLYYTSSPVIVNNKDCFSLKISEDGNTFF